MTHKLARRDFDRRLEPSNEVLSTFTFDRIKAQLFRYQTHTRFALKQPSFANVSLVIEAKKKGKRLKREKKMDSFPIFLGSGLVTKFSYVSSCSVRSLYLLEIWFWSIESRRFWLFRVDEALYVENSTEFATKFYTFPLSVSIFHSIFHLGNFFSLRNLCN